MTHPQTHSCDLCLTLARRLAPVAVLLLSGCGMLAPVDADPFAFPSVTAAAAQHQPVASSTLPGAVQPAVSASQPVATEPDAARNPQRYPGTAQFVRLPGAPRPPVQVVGEDAVQLDFVDAPLAAVLHALLGDLLKLDYTLDTASDAVVSLRTQRPLPKAAVLEVLEALLNTHQLTLRRDSAGVYHVTTFDAAHLAPPVVVGQAQLAQLPGAGVLVAPLRYIGAAEMSRILAPLLPDGALVRADPVRNLLVLRGGKAQLEAWLELIHTFDVDALAGLSVGVFPLQHLSVGELRDALALVLGQPGAALPGSDKTDARDATERLTPLTGVLHVLPIERLNALLVVTAQPKYLDEVQRWIERLDRPADNEIEPQLFVYPVQNTSAVHLAQLLNALFSSDDNEAARTAAPTRFAPTAAAPASTSTSAATSPSLASTGTAAALSSLRRSTGAAALPTSGAAAGGAATGASLAAAASPLAAASPPAAEVPPVATRLAANVRVVADERQNAVLIRAPRKEYRRIVAALKELDRAPTQVLIEANIVEVTLTGSLRYGLEWFLQNSLGSGFTGTASLNLRQSGGIGPTQPGFSYVVANRAGLIRAVLNAAAEKSQLRVLSNPSVLVLDNHTATIQVGQQQPVKSATTVASNAVSTETITYKDTGVLLTVTPSVNAGDLVTLDILQQVTDVGEIDAATGQRQFLTRQIQSRVAVRSGESIVLGGLIRDNDTAGRSGVPLLSDVPLFGELFASNNHTRQRTELLVLLTPRVLPDDTTLRAVSTELRERMRQIRRRVPSADPARSTLSSEDEPPPSGAQTLDKGA